MKNLKLKINKGSFLRTSLFILVSFLLSVSFSINTQAASILQSINNVASVQTGSSRPTSNSNSSGSILQNINNAAVSINNSGSSNNTTVNSTNGVSSQTQTFQPACPFNPQNGRTIVHFDDQNLTNGLRSDSGDSRSSETRSVYLPAGTYNISLQSFDGGIASEREYQPNEKYYLQLKNGDSIIAQTNSTSDLADNVTNSVWYGSVNYGLVLSQSVNTVVAMHSVYPDSSSPNSLQVGCAAFDLVSVPVSQPVVVNETLNNYTNYSNYNIYPGLFVSCYASPSNPQVGDRVNWSVNATGGDGNYNYSWTGTDNFDSSSRSPSITYRIPGSKSATVTVSTGDGQNVSATCFANVYQNQNQNVVLAYSQSYQPPMASAVYLSQIPYTGFENNLVWFILFLSIFSAWLAYVIISYQKNNEIL